MGHHYCTNLIIFGERDCGSYVLSGCDNRRSTKLFMKFMSRN